MKRKKNLFSGSAPNSLMAQDATKIVKRANDDIESDSLDEFQQNNNKSNENENEIGDPWEEMKEENELNCKKEREEKRKERQNELLGIDTEKLNFDDETGLVVPIKNLVNFAGRGRVEFIYFIFYFSGLS